MNPKKNIFSYFIWLIYIAFCGTVLTNAVTKVSALQKFFGIFGEKLLVVCIFFLITIAIYCVLKLLGLRLYEKKIRKTLVGKIWSIVFPILSFVAIVVRLSLYVIQNVPITLNNDSYYEIAKVGSTIPYQDLVMHGAELLYVRLLHVLLLIIGNNPAAGIILQIVLYFVTLLFIYFAIYRLCDVTGASIAILAIGLMPFTYEVIFTLTPQLFLVACYSIGFFITSGLVIKCKEKELDSFIKCMPAILVGLIIGFLIYLDISGVALAFIPVCMFGMGESKKEKWMVVLTNVLLWLGILDFGALLYGFIRIFSANVARQFYSNLIAYYWGKMIFPVDKIAVLLPVISVELSLLMLIPAFWCGLSFLIEKKNRNGYMMSGILWMEILFTTEACYTDVSYLYFVFWAILAGLGISSLFSFDDTFIKQDKELEESGDIVISEVDSIPEDTVQKPLPGQPLPNPLAIPKKRERKQVDFKFQVQKEKECFDKDVKPEDDFDI